MAAPLHAGKELAMVLAPGSPSDTSSSLVTVDQTQLQNQGGSFGTNGQKPASRQVFTLNKVNAEKVEKMRPLNSWIAFRTFYSQMFHNFQQKQVSILVNVLWQADPFKAKWAILAKAYSMIRDKVGKEHAPLDKFLELCCPEIGVIGVSDYLKKLNWSMGSNDKGEFILTQMQTPDFASLEDEIRNCYMSEIDVIEYCVQCDFFPDFDPFSEDMANNPNHLMGVTTMTPDQAKQSFLAAITADPKAIAAQILGWDVDHEFFKICTDSTIPAVAATISLAEHPDLINHVDLMKADMPLANSVSQLENYQWTGSMSELYKPTEISIELDSVTEPNKWSSTDIGNPMALDVSLQAAGYDSNMLNPNLPEDNAENLAYTFGDSF